MKKLVWAFVVAVVMAGSAVAASSRGDQDFTLVNKTGMTIDEFYVSPTSLDHWGEDVLGVDTLANGASVHIKFSRDEDACSWDLKIVDEKEQSVEWEKIDLCKAEEITLVYKGGAATAFIK